MSILSKLLRAGEGRKLKKYTALADYVMSLSDDVEKLSDDELAAKTDEFKGRVAEGETLDDLLPEAFAVAREAASWASAPTRCRSSAPSCCTPARWPR